MLKETITYIDYNNVERTEDFYFNLNEAEVFDMEMGVSGGYAEMLQRIIDAKDTPTLIKIFKDIVLKAYGEKSEDGKRFKKSEELSIAFSQTEAYVKLYMKLVTDDKAAAKFVKGILPAKMNKDANVAAAAAPVATN